MWIHLAHTGIHIDEYLGLVPTSNKITALAIDSYRIVNCKLVEYWEITDQLAFFKQLGIVKYSEKGKKLFQEDAK